MGIVTDVQRIGANERRVDNLERRVLKTGEETGELMEALLSATSVSGGKGKDYMDLLEEACDVVIMGLDIALTKPPGVEMSDDMHRALVKKIIGLKLEKWRKQIDRKGTLIHAGDMNFKLERLQELMPTEDEVHPPSDSVLPHGSEDG